MLNGPHVKVNAEGAKFQQLCASKYTPRHLCNCGTDLKGGQGVCEVMWTRGVMQIQCCVVNIYVHCVCWGAIEQNAVYG